MRIYAKKRNSTRWKYYATTTEILHKKPNISIVKPLK
jgi:hypothetical protein